VCNLGGRLGSAGKEFRVGEGDPQVPLQPYLPGSVVGECSMRRGEWRCKLPKYMALYFSNQLEKELGPIWENLQAGRLFRLAHPEQRMRQGMHRQGDAVGNAGFAHQFGNVGLDGASFDAQCGANFLIGPA
jgi:hypothetical protein